MKKQLLISCCATLLYCQHVFAQAETQNTTFPFWKINGNGGTNSSTNFLGTTDNVSLRFRANNQNYMVLDSNGVVGIGITKTNLSYGYAKFEVASEGIAPADILLRNAVNDPGYAPGLIFQHARGTLSTPTAVVNGDYLAAIQWQNYDGASYIGNAGINVYAEGVVSVGTIPTRIDIYTNGGSVSLNRLGNVGIGIAAPLQKLHVNGSTSGVRIGGLATGGSFITAPAATTDKLLFADANGDVKAVANGSNGSTLTINGSGVPAWAAPGATTEWLLTGNAGTVDGVDFLGTTDNVPFTIRTNNQQSARIDPLNSNAFFGYWAGKSNAGGGWNVAVGTNALLNGISGLSNTAVGNSAMENTNGWNNTGVGAEALQLNTSGANNTAVGIASGYNNTTAAYNTFIGSGVGYTNTTVGELTAVGANALYSNTTGQYLTAVGRAALQANTSGFHGTALGYNSQYSNTTGSYNVSSGAFSLYSNQTGSRNTAVGTSALYGTTSSDNTAVGYEAINQSGSSRGNAAVGSGALRQLTSGNYNVAIGDSAGFAHTTASRNVAIGAFALRSNTTESDQLAIGDNALLSNTTGTKQLAIGSGALRSATTSDGMLAIGYRALFNETSGGFYNTAIGTDALFKTSGAQSNVAVGYYSQRELTSGSSNVSLGNYTLGAFSTPGANSFYGNVVLGHGAALYMRTGYYNNLIGANAGTNMLSGYHNNALGYYALYSDATGFSNTAIGSYALQVSNGANRNVAVGEKALFASTSGQANTAVGYYAGYLNTTGSANTLIGDSAAVGVNNLTNATALGAYARVDASNSLVLGSINGVNGATSNVNVGIGTSAPARPLEIATGQLRFSNALGDIEFTEAADFHTNVTTATPAATAAVMRVHSNSTFSNVLLTLQHNGNLGLGTTTPTNAKLVTQGVVGNTVAIFTGGATGTAAMGVSMVANWPGVYFNSYFNTTTRAMANTGYPAIINTDQSTGGLVFATTSTANTTADATVTVNERMRITGAGLVGIAQAGPGYYLELGFNSGAKPGSNAWTIPSDRRLKKDIEPFADGLSVIGKINPVWYRYNGQGGIKDTSRFAGIVAQELQQVAPYMIGTKERTNTDGSKTEYLDYDGNAMTYLLVNSVKELKAQNDLLQQQIKQLQNRLDEKDKQK